MSRGDKGAARRRRHDYGNHDRRSRVSPAGNGWRVCRPEESYRRERIEPRDDDTDDERSTDATQE